MFVFAVRGVCLVLGGRGVWNGGVEVLKVVVREGETRRVERVGSGASAERCHVWHFAILLPG